MPAIWECRLLDRVYAMDPATWTTTKQDAVNAFSTGTCGSWDQGFANIIVADYASGCGLTSFFNKPYNAKTNPAGPRCDFFDTNANLLARDPVTGFAYRPTEQCGRAIRAQCAEPRLDHRRRFSRAQCRSRRVRCRRAAASADHQPAYLIPVRLAHPRHGRDRASTWQHHGRCRRRACNARSPHRTRRLWCAAPSGRQSRVEPDDVRGAPESLCRRRLVPNLDIGADIIRRIIPQARGTRLHRVRSQTTAGSNS